MIQESEGIKYLDDWNVPLTIWWDEGRKTVKLVDQTRLPEEVKVIECDNWRCIEEAIKVMRIRGAPAIGVASAFALAVEAQRFEGDEKEFFRKMDDARKILHVRLTARNPEWAVQRVYDKLVKEKERGVERLKEIALEEAESILKEDIDTNKRIGTHGLEIFDKKKTKRGKRFRILTHCNAGSLATGGYGTALGVIRTAFREGIKLQVFVDETRPLLQGARITAWELNQEGIPLVLIPDDAAGWIMKKEKIDVVIVGADRITVNGDVTNKIGTYSLSILAKEHKIPFYVAAPTSTIDPRTQFGKIKVEKRSYTEITQFQGTEVAPFLDEKQVRNYAFDTTPIENIDGIITEIGIIRRPNRVKIEKALKHIRK